VDFGEIHDELEKESSKSGVGAAVALDLIQAMGRQQLTALNKAPVKGINQDISLYPLDKVAAAFKTDVDSFVVNTDTGALSLDLEVYLHVAGSPMDVIAVFKYSVSEGPTRPVVDQSDLHVYLEPGPGATLVLKTWDKTKDADGLIKGLGYVDLQGEPDWVRFNQEVISPFIWINGRGLLRAVYRSIAVPQVFDFMRVIKPSPPINAKIVPDYLMTWSLDAAVDYKQCSDAKKAPPGKQKATPVLGVKKPWSKIDDQVPPIVTYYGSQPLLRWHADSVTAAIPIDRQPEGTFLDWGARSDVTVSDLELSFIPSAAGGAIVASFILRALGTVSAWITGPCGVHQDIGSVAMTADGEAKATLTLNLVPAKQRVESSWDVKGGLNKDSVRLSGNLLGLPVPFIAEWLIRLGLLKVPLELGERGHQTLIDLSNFSATAIARGSRVAEHSAAYAFARTG
jgi:hypothetical protein